VEPTIKVDGIVAFDVDLNVFDSVDEAGDGGDDAAEVQDQKAGTVRLGQHVKLTRYPPPPTPRQYHAALTQTGICYDRESVTVLT